MKVLSFFKRFVIKRANNTESLFLDIKLITFAVGLISSLAFLTVYSFLYGYYFSGFGGVNSTFNIVSNLIPFNVQTLSIISIFFVCIYYTISRLTSVIIKEKKNKGSLIIIALVSIVLLNICLTVFFANKITFQSIVSFFFIWIFAGLGVWVFYISMQIEENLISLVKSIMLSILCILPILLIINKPLDNGTQIQEILIISSLLLFTTIFQRWQQQKLIIYISYLPISFFLILITLIAIENYLYTLSFIETILLLIILPLVITKFTYQRIHNIEKMLLNYLRHKFKINNSMTRDEPIEKIEVISSSHNSGTFYKAIIIFYKMFTNQMHIGLKLILCIMLLIIFIWTPRISSFCGQFIRTLNMPYINQVEIIYINHDGTKDSIISNYYIEHNSTLYISNEKWELETIKPINYHIKTVETEN